jgi:hypothetical protein
MAHLKRTQNKLLRAGYLPEEQSLTFEKWIDVSRGGTSISFGICGAEVTGAYKIDGRKEDVPEADLFYSTWTSSLREAIGLSRI